MRLILGPTTFVALLLCAPAKAEAEEAPYTVITATPVEGADPDAGPPKPDCSKPEQLEQLDRIECQNKAMAAEIKSLRMRLDEKVERKVGFGAGLAMQGPRSELMLEGNLQFLFGCYVPGHGGCLGFVPTINVWRLSIRPSGIGIMSYHDDAAPLSVRYIPRDWDVVWTTSGDLDIVGKLRLRVQFTWFFPNPGAVLGYSRDRVEEDVNDYHRKLREDYERAKDVRTEEEAEAWRDDVKKDYDEFRGKLREDSDIPGDAYKKAWKTPWVIIGLRYEF